MSGFVANGGVGTMLSVISDTILNAIWSALGWIWWMLCDIFFLLLDFFELVFRKLAGIDPVYVDGEKQEGDLVLYLIKSDVIQNIFYSILMLSFFLLIIFTVVAIVKNQYVDKPKPVMNIIGDSFKGLLMYLLVPIATIACLMVGNVILQAIDGATRTETSGSASDMLFLAAAYNANYLRDGDFDDQKDWFIEMYGNGSLQPLKIVLEIQYGIGSIEDIEALDEAHGGAETIAAVASLIDEEFTNGKLTVGDDKWSHSSVSLFYKLYKISILTVWIGGAFLIWAYGKMTWGVASRLFKMAVGFAISPALMATYPLNQGKALDSWKGDMVKNGTMAYCAVGVLNILYSIMPLFLSVDIFQGDNFATAIYGQFIKLFLVVIIYSGASKLIDQVSGWFGTGNALAEGIAQADAAKKAVKGAKDKIGSKRKKMVGTFQGIRGGAKKAGDAGKNKFFGGLMGAYKGSGLADSFVDPAAIGKEWNDANKAGGSYYQDLKTNTFNIETNKANKALFEEVEEQDKLSKRLKGINYDITKDTGANTPDALAAAKEREKLLATGEGQWAIEGRDVELAVKEGELEVNRKFKTYLETFVNQQLQINEAEDDINALTTRINTARASGFLNKAADLEAEKIAKERERRRAKQLLADAKAEYRKKVAQDPNGLGAVAGKTRNAFTFGDVASMQRVASGIGSLLVGLSGEVEEFQTETKKIQAAAIQRYKDGDPAEVAKRTKWKKTQSN